MANHYARLLARAGLILFALSLVNGFLIHPLPGGRQLLSAHIIGLIGSGLLFGLAALWPQLKYSPTMSKAGAALAIYGFGAGWLVNLLAGLTGRAGVFPVSVASAGGRSAGDFAISAGLLSVAFALFAMVVIAFRGLRE